MVSGQLLRDAEEVDEINALQQFGKRIRSERKLTEGTAAPRKTAIRRRVKIERVKNDEVMVPAESGHGITRLDPQNVEVVHRRKGKKTGDNYMEFHRRGLRQSHMEEMAHAHIDKLTVDCGPRGISVSLTFSERFDGVVYSKGYFNDPRCT